MLASYSPPALYRPGEITITPWSYQSIAVNLYTIGSGAPASGATVTANMVMFVPFGVPEAVTITKVFWANGTGSAGNVDCGLYNPAGTLLASAGTTAQGTASITQVVDVADVTIPRGLYYMALVGSTVTTQTFIRAVPAVGICQMFGVLQQDISGTGLPLATNASPATFAKCTTAWVPYFGVQGYRTLGP